MPQGELKDLISTQLLFHRATSSPASWARVPCLWAKRAPAMHKTQPAWMRGSASNPAPAQGHSSTSSSCLQEPAHCRISAGSHAHLAPLACTGVLMQPRPHCMGAPALLRKIKNVTYCFVLFFTSPPKKKLSFIFFFALCCSVTFLFDPLLIPPSAPLQLQHCLGKSDWRNTDCYPQCLARLSQEPRALPPAQLWWQLCTKPLIHSPSSPTCFNERPSQKNQTHQHQESKIWRVHFSSLIKLGNYLLVPVLDQRRGQ